MSNHLKELRKRTNEAFLREIEVSVGEDVLEDPSTKFMMKDLARSVIFFVSSPSKVWEFKYDKETHLTFSVNSFSWSAIRELQNL